MKHVSDIEMDLTQLGSLSTFNSTTKCQSGSGTRKRIKDDEARILICKAREGDLDASKSLITIFIPLIHHCAFRYYKPGLFLEFADLVQQGCLGVLKSIEKFDECRVSNGRRVTFVTYATYWILHFMRREIERNGNLIRRPLPRKMVTNNGEDYKSNLTVAYLPIHEEIMAAPDDLEKQPGDSRLYTNAERRSIRKELSLLPVIERRTLEYLYGFNNRHVRSISFIAIELGTSPEHIWHLHNKALRSIRSRLTIRDRIVIKSQPSPIATNRKLIVTPFKFVMAYSATD